MPRRKIDLAQPHSEHADLVARLAEELKSDNDSGQPNVYEMQVGIDRIRVTVIWDEWNDVYMEDRSPVILRAYESADAELCEKIALANGLTVPEATEAGILPYEIIPALRQTDDVTREECETAMLAEGASKLFDPNILKLRFSTFEEAEESRARLIKTLPKSAEIWLINKDLSFRDLMRFQQFADVGDD